VPTAENYLGRVTKARIIEAVREAKGEQAAQRLEGLKKGDMAEAAAQALAGCGWLPEVLRTKGVATMTMPTDSAAEATHSAVAADAGADVADEAVEAADLPSAEDEAQLEPHEIAAE
jgi:ParB family chromosome partitioning protein